MVLECNIFCRAMSPADEELTGKKDPGKWMEGLIDITRVEAVKITSDDEDEPTFNLTTLYMFNGDSYVIDIPFSTMRRVFKESRGNNMVPLANYTKTPTL